MILSGDVAGSVAKRFTALGEALSAAACVARELAEQCGPANADALEGVAERGRGLIESLGRATQEASHATRVAECCADHDHLVTLPAVAQEPGDERRDLLLTDWLYSKVPDGTHSPLPADLDPLIIALEEAAEWLVVRDFDTREHLNAAAWLKGIRAAVLLIESVVRPAVEDDGESTHTGIILALGLARTRLLLRISQRDGTS